jgi:hypothetical protein
MREKSARCKYNFDFTPIIVRMCQAPEKAFQSVYRAARAVWEISRDFKGGSG